MKALEGEEGWSDEVVRYLMFRSPGLQIDLKRLCDKKKVVVGER